jgi:hypothetical protein
VVGKGTVGTLAARQTFGEHLFLSLTRLVLVYLAVPLNWTQCGNVRVSINTKLPKTHFWMYAYLIMDFRDSFLCSVNVDSALLT